MRTNWVRFLMAACLSVSVSAIADDATQQKGFDIAKQRKERDVGWGSSESSNRMILRDAQGNESVRQLRTQALEVQGDGDKSLTIFDQPADVKGTAFLTYSHVDGADEQWLFMPALKRVKRISSNNKSGPFMGSEFAYEDLTSFELDKFRFNWLRDETVNGVALHVIEATPTDRYSGYTKVITWLDTEAFRPLKTEYYDRKGALLKTATMSDYQLHKDKYWRPHRIDMVNHQTGKSTTLAIDSISFDTNLSVDDFTQNSLKRAR
ncbi:outer membrane lipoprotein-sorting protein [Bowmanella sp. JS7-9]|uniref:Outer membrane lipoprotein-sorting protein n=1 Tax=Pseudobowmanella zhangzhouensis TaxID=1537679 RepID=A0ABW1XS81_9ALTE|nr:outer membrane lipoprotein-sorting protein [Bowmanella sp. JS7-9]TBX24444.1 membrane protein [Bowmanella sp. JS7-9]